jgi:hypothetical protein
MTSNNAEWERGGSTFATTVPTSPYTDKVLKEKTDAWHHGVSPSRQERLESLLNALKGLADAGLGWLRSSPTSTTGGSSPSRRGRFASTR